MCDDLWDSLPQAVNTRRIHIDRETPHVHGIPKQTKQAQEIPRTENGWGLEAEAITYVAWVPGHPLVTSARDRALNWMDPSFKPMWLY